MVLLSKPTTEQYSCIRKTPTFPTSIVPVVDLSKPGDAKTLILKACEDYGFFKVINHAVPMEAISNLESQAAEFFSLPLTQKEKAGTPNPFGYGNKNIGRNGDLGWVEYLLLTNNHDYNFIRLSSVFGPKAEQFRNVLSDYMCGVRKMACVILELMAEGLNIEEKNVFSKMMMDKESDSVFRLNHYPPYPENFNNNNGKGMIGFGEHTDPQIISLLRSNNSSGLQICLRDRSWVSVPPDHNSFFVNVGDALQVLTNGRFRSVRHRVLANGLKSRLSMIYFCGPPLSERIAPLPSLLLNGKESLYNEFTWFEYKSSAYATRLADNRLSRFERISATSASS